MKFDVTLWLVLLGFVVVSVAGFLAVAWALNRETKQDGSEVPDV